MNDTWYSGLRTTQSRPLTDDDRAALAHLRRERAMRSYGAWALPPALLLIGWLGSFVFGADWLRITSTIAVGLVVTFRPWRTHAALGRQIASLARDEAGGEVLVCEGTGGDLVFELDEERRLQPASLVRGSLDEALTVELLPESGAILSVNGRRPRTWNTARKGATAVPSDHAKAAAAFVRPLANAPYAVGERPMSAEEVDELLAHAPELSRLDRLLTMAVAALFVASWWQAVVVKTPTLALPIISTIAVIWTSVRALRRWRLHRRFARDIAARRILIIRQAEEGVISGPPTECLPYSGALWSFDHVPAPWRRLPLRRMTYRRRSA